MKRIIICLVVVTACIFHPSSNPALSATERRIALVIGNGAYKSAPLRNPVNDASDIANALKKLGFSVTLKTNAIQRTMERAIRDFGKKLRDGGVGLFYYAGHGIQIKGHNYLIPLNAVVESEGDVKYEAVDAGLVLAKMEDAGNSLNIIILDACRDNPFGRSFRSSDRGLAKMDAPTGSILAYATAPGSVASDGPGRNGLYTSALLKHMMAPSVKIEDVFKQVRIEVVGESGKKQVPWESSSLTGDFFFNTDRGIGVVKHKIIAAEAEKLSPTIPKSQQATMEMELAFWQSIQNSKNPASFKAYLEQFPQGTFAALAKVKIDALETKKLDEERKRLKAKKKKMVEKETPKIAAMQPEIETSRPKVIFEDSFNDNSNNWSERNSGEVYLQVKKGYYTVRLKKCKKKSWFTWKKINLSDEKDFVIETELRKKTGWETSWLFGLVWGAKDQKNCFIFGITHLRKYIFAKKVNGKFHTIIKWTTSNKIKERSQNKLKIEKISNRIKFYINDEFVNEEKFERFMGKGVGFTVFNCQSFEVDKIVVIQLE